MNRYDAEHYDANDGKEFGRVNVASCLLYALSVVVVIAAACVCIFCNNIMGLPC